MGGNPEMEPGAGVEVERIRALQNKLREQYAEFEGGLYSQLKELGQKGASKEWEDYLNGLTQHLDSTHSIITQPAEQIDINELEQISSTTEQFLTNAKNYLAQNNATEQKPEFDQNNVVAEAGEDVKNKPFEDLKEKMTVAEPEEPQEEPTEKEPEGSEKLSQKQERISQATQKARERTENFIRDHITPYLELGTAREAGSINIFEKIDERWSKWRMEREMVHLKEALKVTQNNLAVYRQRSAKIEANIGKLSILAEQRPDLEKRLERLKTKLAPEIEELAGLINLQEALLKEYGNSLKVLAGALDVELEENVEAGINKGIPEISGGSGFSADNTDAYMTQYDSRIDGMFGTAGSSKELPRSMQGKRSAIEKFFMWFLGLENGVGLRAQKGVA